MKTKEDYFKKVLGLSVPLPLKVEKQKRQKPFCFLCFKEDFERNKEFVEKILSAVGKGKDIVFFDLDKAENFREVYCFGVKGEDLELSFPNFSEIKKSQPLKAQLWKEFKKRQIN